MHVITYSPNYAPPHFAARGIPKNTPHGTMEGHLLTFIVVCLPLLEGVFFFSIHNAHTFARPDIFRKVWKRKRSLPIGTAFPNAVPMGKLLFLPVRLRDVNVPIS